MVALKPEGALRLTGAPRQPRPVLNENYETNPIRPARLRPAALTRSPALPEKR